MFGEFEGSYQDYMLETYGERPETVADQASVLVDGVEVVTARGVSIFEDEQEREAHRTAMWEAQEGVRDGQAVLTFMMGFAVEERFMRLLAKLQKRAAHGAQTLEVLERKVVDIPSPYLSDEAMVVRRIEITLSVPPMVGEKGRVLGIYEAAEKTGHYLKLVDKTANDVVEGMRVHAGECAHCGVNQRRKHTFVCETADGIKMIGASCLKAYMGADPVRMLSFWDDLNNFKGDPGGWRKGEEYVDLGELLRTSYRVARRFGGYSKEESRKHVGLLMFGNRGYGLSDYERKRNQEIIDSYKGFDPEFDREGFTDYIRSLKPGNPFHENIKMVLAQEDFVLVKRIGVIVAAVGLSVGRALEREEDARKKADAPQRPPAKHLDAAEGQRVDFVGEVVRTNLYTNDFGETTCIVAIRCDDGSAVVNFHTGKYRPEAGKRYAIRATIKRHGANKRSGEPETTINRAVYAPADPSQGALI
ncbi:hypothetical protein CcrKarma_gp188 [Caulobacter virus Karma]|uniref:hypothetical protein n=1 Tax=Caulobacter virus Karma TaxID=1211641 RepID=UPI00028B406B|nr:hypothetical protein CcrKarma_gp188 [Caulobacter virus Karma]AFU87705.1 hypothetical protein CcrKarma_gp188 [Caulobacter virus Karma]